MVMPIPLFINLIFWICVNNFNIILSPFINSI